MRKTLIVFLSALILILESSSRLSAQETAAATQAGTADQDAMLQAIEQATPVAAANVPEFGTFYSAQNPDSAPSPENIFGVPVWPMGDGFYLLDDLNQNNNSLPTRSASRNGAQAMSVDPNDPGDGSDTNAYIPNGSPASVFFTNGLWLQLTNIAGGLAYVNLNNATDLVYEIFSKTDLTLTNWSIESEVWPTNGAVMPFTVAQLNRTNLFLWARDWTGVTSNGNTTPDWWFWKYFGTLALSDTNLDSQGNTLLSDYQNGLDPNVISFSLAVTNNYVNNMNAAVQLNISAGTPSYYTVSVDDTNYASDANWKTYAGTSLNVNLGLTEGWHDVWVGLKGLPSNATQTWQYKRLKLDYTAPLLVVTNPTVSTVSVPMIQLQGYCSEALNSIRYDLTNAAGLVTNQDAGITGQFYSTNTFEFTTNYFEALDIPLTNGLNIITLHATDMAGNNTTTSINITLDYSSRTNPPAVQLFWPQNGTLICNSNYTWRGWVDDPTAAVTAQLVDTNGNVNIFYGIVERDGNFWVENLPLANGTNWLMLTVTDSAGNAATTNITVYPGAVGLTITMPDASLLWSQGITVSGTISDSGDYTVWVNGVKATFTGTNYDSNGNLTEDEYGFIWWWQDYKEQDSIPWADGIGGNGTVNWQGDGGSNFGGLPTAGASHISWPPSSWPDVASGAITYTGDAGDDDNTVAGSPVILEHCSLSMPLVDLSGPWTENYSGVMGKNVWRLTSTRHADAVMKLQTGGKGTSARQNLFCLNATATRYVPVKDPPPGSGKTAPSFPVPPQNIQIDGKYLGSDGNLWRTYADNDTRTVTPQVSGADYYSFGVSATKYTLTLTANGQDLSTNTPEFCVGQQVTFTLNGLPTGSIVDMLGRWSLPGKYVNEAYAYSDTCTSYRINDSLLANTDQTSCWFVNKPGGKVSVGLNLKFNNGQYASVAADGNITVFRPNVTFPYTSIPPMIPVVTNGWLELGNASKFGGDDVGTIQFNALITSKTPFSGVVNWTQLINRSASYPANATDTGGQYDLDTGQFYNDVNTPINILGTNPNPRGVIGFYDSPGVGTSILGVTIPSISIHDQFKTYLVFNPGGGIWVTLGIISWGWSASESSGSILTSSSVTSPSYSGSDEFPVWNAVTHGQ